MFHCGTSHPHLASCFLLPITDDSIEDIFETNKRCALISKSAGGIGFSISNVRAAGRHRIHGWHECRHSSHAAVLRGDGTLRRSGWREAHAFAAYLEPWHADVRTFLDMKKNHGAEELRARDLFYALWIPDLFMRRVEANEMWSLFCPSKCPDLIDLVGPAFEKAYLEYEQTPGMAVSVIQAQDLWYAILDAQIETGTPFMLYKDACNPNNHRHLGTIRSSNVHRNRAFSSADEIAVCNLASIALPLV